jgi:hypothetical protein
VFDHAAATVPASGDAFTTDSVVRFDSVLPGLWWLHARAKDVAGNMGVAAHYAVNIIVKTDVLAPGPVTIASPTHPSAGASENNSPVFKLSASDDDWASATAFASGVLGYHYVLDHAAGTIPVATDSFTPGPVLKFTGLRNDTWWLHARAKDASGNPGPAAHYQITVLFTGRILEEKNVHAVPHPIRSQRAVIRYELGAPAQEVLFEFLDAAGHRVGRQAGPSSPGIMSVTWDTTGLANGVYFCRIRARRQDGREDLVMKKLAVIH